MKNNFYQDILDSYTLIDINDFLKNKFLVDLIVSMGNTCRSANALERNGLRYFSSPFDWMRDYSLEQIIYFLENGLINFFKNYIIEQGVINNSNYMVRDLSTGMRDWHSFKNNKDIKLQIDNFLTTHNRRFNRLLNYFRTSKYITILSHRTSQIRSILNFIRFIEFKFNKKVLYINIEDFIIDGIVIKNI